MKVTSYLLFALLSISVLYACKKDEETEQPPVVKMLLEQTAINGKVNEKIAFSALNTGGKAYEQKWTLNGVVKSQTSAYDFTPLNSGIYTIEYAATNAGGSFNYKYTVNVGVPTVPVTPSSNVYVTKMFDYLPAPGQFINITSGNKESAEGILGKKGLVSLGAWGGYIVLGFDHTVINETDKEDLIVYGNAQATLAEPAVIWLMQDENGNGLPDDTWYEVAGSEFNKEGYVRNYEVTYTKPDPKGDVPWKDNKGNMGVVKTNTFHIQPYFPDWVSGNEYTLKGSLLPSSGINMSNPSLVTSIPLAFGYADNTAGGDKIDIASAIDENGKKVSLAGIDFIKIQTGIQANMGWLGELSTEVTGVADLSLVK